MVNGHECVYVERRGLLEETAVRFDSEEELRNAIERILAPLGRRIDELSPMVDARLADGSRVNVVIPPLAIDGPTLSIRRFGASRPGPEELVELGTLSAEQRQVLEAAVADRRSVLVSGGTGSGKTTLLNALSSFIGAGERVVTIEDAAELRLQQPHVVRLESRPAGVEGRGEVTIRDLLRNALRMRPDRIVIGEVRGAEALDLLTALNTGHDGALSTVHANSPADALARLETLALMAGVGLPHAVDRRAGPARHRPRRPPAARGRRRSPGDRDRRGGMTTAAPDRGARGRPRRRWRCGRRAGQPRGGAPGSAWPWSRCARPGAKGTCRRASSGAGWRSSARVAAGLAGWLLAGRLAGACCSRSPARPRSGWAIASRRRRYRRAARAGAAGGRHRDRRLAQRRPLAAGVAGGGDRLPGRAGGRRAGAARGPSSSSVRRPARCSTGGGGRMRSPRVDAFAAALLSQRLAGGDLAGLLRRFAAGAAERERVAEDARSATAQARFTGLLVVAMPTRWGGLRRADRAGLPRHAPGLAAGRGPARARGRAAAGRLRRDSAPRPGGRVSAAGLLAAVAVLLGRRGGAGAAAGASLGRSAGRGRLSDALAAAGKRVSAPWWRAAAAVLAAPAAPGRTALLVAVALPVAGFLAPDAWRRRQSRRRHRRLVAALPDALDLLAVSAGAGRGATAGLEQIARSGRRAAGRGAARSPSPRSPAASPSARRCRRLRSRVPGVELASAGRGDRALPPLRLAPRRPAAPPGDRPAPRQPSAKSRSEPPAPRRKSSWSSPSSSSPRCC